MKLFLNTITFISGSEIVMDTNLQSMLLTFWPPQSHHKVDGHYENVSVCRRVYSVAHSTETQECVLF